MQRNDKMKEPKAIIAIPFKEMNDDVRACIKYCLELNYKNYELVLLPDKKIKGSFPKTKVVPTGPIVPALKRDKLLDIDYDLFASIDSDAYPDKDWLSNAAKIFKDKRVAAVGGPNLPPKNASLLEKAAIDVIYSRLGLAVGYYVKNYKKNSYECKELASSNLILRKSDLVKVKGYHTKFLTGEDTILGFKLRNLGKKIIHSEDVKVYHHRRPLFWPHLSRIFKQASDKVLILLKYKGLGGMIYFVPALFVLFLVFGLIISAFNIYALLVYGFIIAFYSLLVVLESLNLNSLKRMILFWLGLPLTHIFYGLGFLHGLIFRMKELKDMSS